MNSSASGGYLQPSSTTPLPNSYTLLQFLQSVLVGVSGIPGPLVRPRWQANEPIQPNIATNWIAFAVNQFMPDANNYFDLDPDGNGVYQRHEELTLGVAFYGPDSLSYAGLVRDGLQMNQNLDMLRQANMGFVNTGQILRMPDLVNQRWVEKYEMEIVLRREIMRLYPVLSFAQASGSIYYVDSNGEEQENSWKAPVEIP